jgi:hypothetical protein
MSLCSLINKCFCDPLFLLFKPFYNYFQGNTDINNNEEQPHSVTTVMEKNDVRQENTEEPTNSNCVEKELSDGVRVWANDPCVSQKKKI